MLGWITARDPDQWRLVGRIKRVFGPNGIIAPGRHKSPA
jgi:hypothetical protein